MATKYGAYAGKVLIINLTEKSYKEYPLNDKDRKYFIGAKVLAARILYDFIKGPIDPLSEENVVVISTGPLNNTNAPSSSRFNISTISPLTGILTSSNCGGNFGIRLKKAGYDALILTGKCDKLTYIDIYEEKLEFKDAAHLQGMRTSETQEIIGGKSGKLVIGPAGENLVRYACAISEERAAGRGGVGAVLGSKNIKAIVADGKKNQPIYNADKFNELRKSWTLHLKNHPLTGEQLPKLGTAGLLSSMQHKKMLATRNFSAGQFEGYKTISGEEMAEKFLVKNKGCFTCPIQCGRVVEIDGKQVKGPEVEALGLLGANLLNDDLAQIIRWNYELDELGMDAISTAGTLAFSMELNEKDLWKSGLEFGKIDNIAERLKEIAYRSSEAGNEMANGSRYLMEKYGGEDFCIQSKGMELAAYEPRSAVGQGLGYATANRGGCHLNAGYEVVMEGLGLQIDQYTPRGKAQIAILLQNLMEGASAYGNCLFTTYAFFPAFLFRKPNSFITRMVNKMLPFLGPILAIINKWPGIAQINLTGMLQHPNCVKYATGIKMNMGEMMRLGARGFNLERIINEKLGIDAKDDKLPKRLTETLQDENNPKSKVPLEFMKKQYYKGRGWSQDGKVSLKTKKYYKLVNLEDISSRELEIQEEISVVPPKPKKNKNTTEKK